LIEEIVKRIEKGKLRNVEEESVNGRDRKLKTKKKKVTIMTNFTLIIIQNKKD
jgi:hypothetical protein